MATLEELRQQLADLGEKPKEGKTSFVLKGDGGRPQLKTGGSTAAKQWEAEHKRLTDEIGIIENSQRDLTQGAEYADELLGEDFSLGRLQDQQEIQDVQSMLRDNVDMSSQEQIAMRESATTGLQTAEQSNQRQLMSQLASSGVKGGAAGAAMSNLAAQNMQNRAQLEQNLYLQQQNLRRAAVSELAGWQTQVSQFDLGQAAAEQNARIQAQLAYTNLASNERSSIRQIEASLEAARLGAKKGKK